MILPALILAATAPTASEIVRDAPAAAWRAVAPDNLLILDSPKGQVLVELAPGFAPVHVASIRALVRAGRFDGGAVVRVQDNYVVQFAVRDAPPGSPAATAVTLPPEYERPAGTMTRLPYPDAYAPRAGWSGGWPIASDGRSEWLVHCYAMVGAGRNLPPDSGDGSELYAVSGHAPRHLDRNIALVGRVVEGMSGWTSLARGTEALGFYKTPAERTPVTRARLAADLPAAERPRVEAMDTASPSFAAYVEARANRRDAFFLRPAGAVDLCNAPVPVRRAP